MVLPIDDNTRPADYRPVAALRSAAALIVAALLCGCSGDSDFGARAFVVQRKHDWRTCEQITGLHASLTQQINDLKQTMDKASRDPGGGFVNLAAHGPTMTNLQAERRLLHESIVEKNCTMPAAAKR